MILFSERKKLAEEYEKWISNNKDVLECPFTVISWLVGEGYLDNTKQLQNQLSLTEKALKIAIIELDFARNHSQSTSQESVDRIEKLENKIWKQAKEMMKSE